MILSALRWKILLLHSLIWWGLRVRNWAGFGLARQCWWTLIVDAKDLSTCVVLDESSWAVSADSMMIGSELLQLWATPLAIFPKASMRWASSRLFWDFKYPLSAASSTRRCSCSRATDWRSKFVSVSADLLLWRLWRQKNGQTTPRLKRCESTYRATLNFTILQRLDVWVL